MGLFDSIKEKASELLGGASDKVSELTGTELPGQEAAENVAGNVTETAQGYGEQAQGVGETATGAAQDVTDSATESFNNATEQYRP